MCVLVHFRGCGLQYTSAEVDHKQLCYRTRFYPADTAPEAAARRGLMMSAPVVVLVLTSSRSSRCSRPPRVRCWTTVRSLTSRASAQPRRGSTAALQRVARGSGPCLAGVVAAGRSPIARRRPRCPRATGRRRPPGTGARRRAGRGVAPSAVTGGHRQWSALRGVRRRAGLGRVTAVPAGLAPARGPTGTRESARPARRRTATRARRAPHHAPSTYSARGSRPRNSNVGWAAPISDTPTLASAARAGPPGASFRSPPSTSGPSGGARETSAACRWPGRLDRAGDTP